MRQPARSPAVPEGSTNAAYFSRFGGFWIDRSDAVRVLEEKLASGWLTAAEALLFREWHRQGYVVLEKAVAPDVIDQINADCRRFWSGQDPRLRAVESGSGKHVPPTPALWATPGCRLLDIYFYSAAAREAIFSAPIVRFLNLLFERDLLAFQSLTFEQGSQQGIHQDTAYVVVSSPLEMAASWIALEDVQPGAGELSYYEGSHRLPEFLFGETRREWNPEIDGPEQHAQFSLDLHTNAKKMGLPLRQFGAKKGDVLIWHADLAHGGAAITHVNPQVTRRSLVTHYCPYDVEPRYFQAAPNHRARTRFAKNCYYGSWDYLAADRLPASSAPTTEPRSSILSPVDHVFEKIKPVLEPFLPAFVRAAGNRLAAVVRGQPRRRQ